MSNFISRVVPKVETQDMIKALRDAGIEVQKSEGGYTSKVETKGGVPVFKAMIGRSSYLVRYHKKLFITE